MCGYQVDGTVLESDMSTWPNWEPYFLEFHFLYDSELAKRRTCARFQRQKWSRDQYSLRVIGVRCGDGHIQRCLVGPPCSCSLAFKHVFAIFSNLSVDLMSPSTLTPLYCWLYPFLPFSSILCHWSGRSFSLKLSLFFSLYSFWPDFYYYYMLMVLKNIPIKMSPLSFISAYPVVYSAPPPGR